jgi:DNA-binding SARP family transcriptional activator
LQTNSLLEVLHTRLVWLYAQTGQRESALEQYEQCRNLLQQELAVEPSTEMMALL